jgi:ABC-type antimicrobial peptide transport system permease subunit
MPGQSYVLARPFTDLVDEQRRSWLFGATMFVAFGALALVVAALGLYSVIAYNVAQRSHELGVRVALGAQTKDVAQLVVGQGVRVALVGVVVGAAIAFVLGSRIEPLLFKVSGHDPLVFGAVAALLMAVAIVASAGPALRAARADPNVALRAE